jgi:kynurenine formamidase
VPLGMPLTRAGPVFGDRDRPWHYVRYKRDPVTGFADDLLVLNSHSSTHLDGLGHGFLRGRMYNGASVDEHVTSFGVTANGISNVGGIVTRGVLLDVAAHTGVPRLEPGFVITADLLAECEQAQGVRVGEGDACLIRTGWSQVTRAELAEGKPLSWDQPGCGLSVAGWFHERGACLLGADNAAVDVLPGEPGVRPFGLHPRIIASQGGYLLEYLDLEDLSAAGRANFLFMLAPLLLTGGTGSPVNPLAVL